MKKEEFKIPSFDEEMERIRKNPNDPFHRHKSKVSVVRVHLKHGGYIVAPLQKNESVKEMAVTIFTDPNNGVGIFDGIYVPSGQQKLLAQEGHSYFYVRNSVIDFVEEGTAMMITSAESCKEDLTNE